MIGVCNLWLDSAQIHPALFVSTLDDCNACLRFLDFLGFIRVVLINVGGYPSGFWLWISMLGGRHHSIEAGTSFCSAE